MAEKELVKKQNIFGLMAIKYHLNEEDFKNTIKATLMSVDKNGKYPSDEDIAAFLIVSHQYNLNPFTGEIMAFPNKKGGITPMVGVDGYSRILNSQPDYDGMEIEFSPELVTPENGKKCPEWCEVRIFKKNILKPTIIREYIDEVYVPERSGFAGPWQSHTKRQLRHKTINQAVRIAFGITGIYDEDEAKRIQESQVIEAHLTTLKPDVEIPKALEQKPGEKKPAPEDNLYKKMLNDFALAKEKIGEKLYYEILGNHGIEHANEIRKVVEGMKILEEMRKEYERQGSIKKEEGR